MHITSRKTKCLITPEETKKVFDIVQSNAEKIGMQINTEKTKLVAFSSDTNIEYEASFVAADGGVITSENELKVLGVTLDSRAGPEPHIKSVERGFHRKIWIIRNLKKAGAEKKDLIQAYTSYIRPCIEYASVVIHSILSVTQGQRLERLQERALRTISGWNKTYSDALEDTGLVTLEERRAASFQKFAMSVERSERFSQQWLTPNTSEANTRRRERYVETCCKTEKYRRTPANELTRVLNKIHEQM